MYDGSTLAVMIVSAILIGVGWLGWFAGKEDIRNDCKTFKQFVFKGQIYACVKSKWMEVDE